ncbi:MAG: T9SS type A sorting domain-containing protein [Chitinophagaceae bacterium]
MKKLLLLGILLSCTQLFSQSVPGITKISNGRSGLSFMFKDQQNRIWSGYGGMQYFNTRKFGGLMRTDASHHDSVLFNTGTFTDGLEWNNTIYIAADNGLYLIKNDTLSQLSSPVNGNTLQVFHDSLFIGTSSFGLYLYKNGGLIQKRIKIDNRYFDTINDLASDGQSLWIATNSGLVRYKNGNFSLINTPVYSILMPKYERRILSVETDALGRVWFSNASSENGINTFYVIDQSVITPVKDYFNSYCEINKLLPDRIDHLTRANNGTILLGTPWGLIEFGNSVKYFPIDAGTLRDSFMSSNALLKVSDHFFITFEDQNGHYIAACNAGIFDIDRSVYSLEKFTHSAINTYKRSVSEININDIHANITNDGTWFNGDDLFRIFNNSPQMQLSSISCKNTMFSSGLWLGAKISGDTNYYVSAQTYKSQGSDYISGPVNVNTLTYDPSLASKYNRIWSVSRQEIDDFIANRLKANYQIPASILEWPGNPETNTLQEMAPYVDVDQNSKYEPNKGDYPKIKGDQMLWWVFNDAITHFTPKAKSLNFQINASCYAYNNKKSTEKDSNFLANRTIIFDFTIHNLSKDKFEDLYIGIMNDPDLGFYGDDYVSCDTNLNIGYAFNADSYDDLPSGFGNHPPMLACQFLNYNMHYFTGYNNSADPISGNPRKASDFYRLMAGPNTRNLSFYKKPCDLLTGGNQQGDRRFMMSAKIGNLDIGQSFKLNFAYFIQYDSSKNYLKDDCNAIQTSGNRIKNWYENNSFPSFSYWSSDIQAHSLKPLTIYPNPAQSHLMIDTKLTINKISIIDMSGRKILEFQSPASIQIDALAEGLYQIIIETEQGVFREKFIKH